MSNIPAIYDRKVVYETEHHPAMSELVDLLCHKTGVEDRDFFTTEVAYFLGLIPACMRTMIDSPERGIVPVNIYSIALATSGFGKGHSVTILESVLKGFKRKFTEDTFYKVADDNLFYRASAIAARKGTEEADEFTLLQKDFDDLGEYPFNFCDGTGPGLKDIRYKLLLAGIGSINFQLDEIGFNLSKVSDILDIYLELYDLGRTKIKLIKNTRDQKRGMDIDDCTHTNMLMFGTHSKLLDGSATEDSFYTFLSNGYARRCFFGMGIPNANYSNIDPEQVYDNIIQSNQNAALSKWHDIFERFASRDFYDLVLEVPREVGIELVAYRMQCEAEEHVLPEHEEIRKAELKHRFSKSLRLAGVYAFLDQSGKITLTHLRQAIKVTEQLSKSFNKILKRERNFVRLAKYLAVAADNLTHADLIDDLPFYPSGMAPRKEMMDLATAWGINNHIVIAKNNVEGVEFFSGSSLRETDLNKLWLSGSKHFAYNFKPYAAGLEDLGKNFVRDGFNWTNHRFVENHRTSEKVIPGFNMVVFDIDGDEFDQHGNQTKEGIELEAVHDLLANYTFITYTTKRHEEHNHRFRLIMPTNYTLELNVEDYKAFMDSVFLWLPFTPDTAAKDPTRKWETNAKAEVYINRGPDLLNVLPFIPKTKQNTTYIEQVKDLQNLDALERWFMDNTVMGNRNNSLYKYGMFLVDGGLTLDEVERKVEKFNSKLSKPLSKDELYTTVLKSIASKCPD